MIMDVIGNAKANLERQTLDGKFESNDDTQLDRALLRSFVNAYSKNNNLNYADTWKKLYLEVENEFGFELSKESKSPMDFFVEEGCTSVVFQLAQQIFV